MPLKIKTISLLILFLLLAPVVRDVSAQAVDEAITDDYDNYQKYSLCQKYEKKEKYKKYKKYQDYKKKYGFANSAQRILAKENSAKYKLYKKNPTLYRRYVIYAEDYKKYKNYDKYVNGYKKYDKYKNYKKYNKSEYSAGKNYCGADYQAGYDRYLVAQAQASATIGEADLGGTTLGPQISVGLVKYSKDDLTNSSFNLSAFSATTGSPLAYVIKNSAETVLATIPATPIAPLVTQTKVRYLSNRTFRLYDSVLPELQVADEVRFGAADPASASDIVFKFNRPNTDNDDYRGELKLRYWSNPAGADEIWAINTLPLEQYVWGMGEMTGTGPDEHDKVMTTVFRTYGYWKMKFSTKYAPQGFKVNATPGNQIYYGYAWEITHPDILKGAQATRGQILMHLTGPLNEIALTPYSSWTDGRTRSFAEVWGSTEYPWCQSVADAYGKNSALTTQQLQDAGNHMVGLSAHGSLNLAGDNYKWPFSDILNYYFHSINFRTAY
jgi:hypothetical protein